MDTLISLLDKPEASQQCILVHVVTSWTQVSIWHTLRILLLQLTAWLNIHIKHDANSVRASERARDQHLETETAKSSSVLTFTRAFFLQPEFRMLFIVIQHFCLNIYYFLFICIILSPLFQKNMPKFNKIPFYLQPHSSSGAKTLKKWVCPSSVECELPFDYVIPSEPKQAVCSAGTDSRLVTCCRWGKWWSTCTRRSSTWTTSPRPPAPRPTTSPGSRRRRRTWPCWPRRRSN